MSHVPPRRGKRKGTLAAFNDQAEQSKRMKKSRGKDETPDVGFDIKDAMVWGQASTSIWPQGFRIYMESDCQPSPLPRRKATEGFAAYRTWRACRDEQGRIGLASTAHDFLWDGPVLRDADPPAEHEGFAGHTGIHGYKEVTRALTHGVPHWAVVGMSPLSLARPRLTVLRGMVLGEVLLFGTVVVHEDGYRAQCAMIRSLYVLPEAYIETPGIVDALAERYGCDVFTDHAKWLGGNHGNGR